MSDQRTPLSRRRFLKNGLLGLTLAPLAGLLASGRADAEKSEKSDKSETPKLDPSSKQAKNLSYAHDASKVDNPAKGEGEKCANCQLFKGGDDAQWGKCSIFPGKLVNADGWCSAYTPASG